jgi:hypothetical protein
MAPPGSREDVLASIGRAGALAGAYNGG